MSLLLALAVAALSLPTTPAIAAMVETEQLLDETVAGEAEGGRLRELPTRDELRAELREMGLDPDEAAARVDALSDMELAALAGRIEALPAGQELKTRDKAVYAAIFILVIVLVLL